MQKQACRRNAPVPIDRPLRNSRYEPGNAAEAEAVAEPAAVVDDGDGGGTVSSVQSSLSNCGLERLRKSRFYIVDTTGRQSLCHPRLRLSTGRHKSDETTVDRYHIGPNQLHDL